MKLELIIDSLDRAGAESSLSTMAPHLARAGVQVSVIALTDRLDLGQELLSAGIRVVASPHSRPVSTAGVKWLTSQLRKSSPDLVHTTLFASDVTGRTAARLSRLPVVSSLVNTSYDNAHRREPGIRRSRLAVAQVLDAGTARFAQRLHALTEIVATEMSGRLRYPRSRIDVIPRGRDRRSLGERTPARRKAVRKQLGVGDHLLVLCVARQEPQKSIDTLLKAVDEIPASAKIGVLIAGRAGNSTQLLQTIHSRMRFASNVKFLGSRTDVPDLLCAADVLVLPSLREGLGGSLIEAMALDCPVVVSDLPVFDEVVGSAAYRFPPLDYRALATVLADLDGDRAAARAHVAEARHRYELNFTSARVAAQMLAFYEKALNSPR